MVEPIYGNSSPCSVHSTTWIHPKMPMALNCLTSHLYRISVSKEELQKDVDAKKHTYKGRNLF